MNGTEARMNRGDFGEDAFVTFLLQYQFDFD